MASKPPFRTVFVVSDGTGDTAQGLALAALRQFPSHPVQLQTFPMTESEEELRLIFERAKRREAMVVTTLVSEHMRRHAEELSKAQTVPHVELLGPILAGFSDFLHRRPREVPGLYHTTDERYFRRIEAIEFTLRADDGKDPRLIPEADIVLVGVSRTGKTPLSSFLAHKGYKVCNQPLVLGQQVPSQLFAADPRRVFALTIAPEALQEIRRTRMQAMFMDSTTNYCDMDYILAELEYARELGAGNMWPQIEVTNKAIEETAATIFRMMQSNRLLGPISEVSQLNE